MVEDLMHVHKSWEMFNLHIIEPWWDMHGIYNFGNADFIQHDTTQNCHIKHGYKSKGMMTLDSIILPWWIMFCGITHVMGDPTCERGLNKISTYVHPQTRSSTQMGNYMDYEMLAIACDDAQHRHIGQQSQLIQGAHILKAPPKESKEGAIAAVDPQPCSRTNNHNTANMTIIIGTCTTQHEENYKCKMFVSLEMFCANLFGTDSECSDKYWDPSDLISGLGILLLFFALSICSCVSMALKVLVLVFIVPPRSRKFIRTFSTNRNYGNIRF